MSLARLISLGAAVVFCLVATSAQAVTLPIDDDLVLWLKADAGVTLTSGKVSQWNDQVLIGDNTTSNNAAQGSGTYRPTVVDNASPNGLLPMLRFDANPYLSIANHADLNPGTGGYTIFLAGQRIDTSTVARGWLSKQASGSNSVGYSIWSTIELGNTNVSISGGSSTTKGSQTRSRPTDFSVLTMLATGSEVSGFLNGSSTGWYDGGGGPSDNLYSGDVTNTRSLYVGRGYGGSHPLSGDIGEILIYKAELSATDRAAVEDYLDARWNDTRPALLMLPMNEGAGPTAFDSTGGNDATLDGATWTSGVLGQALHFDGNDRAVVGGAESDFDFALTTDGFTVEAWVKADDIGSSMSMVSKAAQASALGGWDFWCDPSGKLGFRLFDGSAPSPTAMGATRMDENEWYHVVGTWNGSNTDADAIKVYVNGILDGQSTAMNPWVDNNFAVTIGKLAGGSANWFFDGKIDEVAIFDRELSAQEIHDRYANVVPEPCTSLLLALAGLCLIVFGRRRRKH